MLPFHDEPVIWKNIIAKILFASCSAIISYRKNFRVYGKLFLLVVNLTKLKLANQLYSISLQLLGQAYLLETFIKYWKCVIRIKTAPFCILFIIIDLDFVEISCIFSGLSTYNFERRSPNHSRLCRNFIRILAANVLALWLLEICVSNK